MNDKLKYVPPSPEVIDGEGSEITPNFIYAYAVVFFTAVIALSSGVYANVLYTNNVGTSTNNNTVYA